MEKTKNNNVPIARVDIPGDTGHQNAIKPMILAPAGNRAAFFAAIAAGADAVYCGLKIFSARMAAKNFTLEELAVLTRFAHKKGVKVYVTLNTLLKPGAIEKAGRMLSGLSRHVKPDAVIIQDLGFLSLVKQAGFKGEVHLSTLANITFPAALKAIAQTTGAHGVVMPRELSIDEIKAMAKACPDGFSLEAFIHGALCYGVSGRCYWSSYMGGKSSLKGRCVQPCRRIYTQRQGKGRSFSCQDLSVDVLAKVLAGVQQVGTWKIEGRKKGPHYVYYTVSAYRMLRDQGKDPKCKRAALGLLSQSLGRTTTHYNFLSQRPQTPVNEEGQTGSGLLIGRVHGGHKHTYVVPYQQLLAGDMLRIGYEDEPGHGISRVTRSVPKKGKFHFRLKTRSQPKKGTPVFLTDRREKALVDLLTALENEADGQQASISNLPVFKVKLPTPARKKINPVDMLVSRRPAKHAAKNATGVWINPHIIKNISRANAPHTWFWMPPVIWPENEGEIIEQVSQILGKGGRNFVLNATWQTAFFENRKKCNLWAGPFCNIANPLSIDMHKKLGFSGVIVSPELGEKDYFLIAEKSPLPIGIVAYGNWPLCVSRTVSNEMDLNTPFASPKGEGGWVSKIGPDYWVFPNWRLDITEKKKLLKKAGFSLFVYINEPVPKTVKMKNRPGLWNWKIGLT